MEDALEGRMWEAGGLVGAWRSPLDCRWWRLARGMAREWTGVKGMGNMHRDSKQRDQTGRSPARLCWLWQGMPLTEMGHIGGEAVLGAGEEGWCRPKANTSKVEIVVVLFVLSSFPCSLEYTLAMIAHQTRGDWLYVLPGLLTHLPAWLHRSDSQDKITTCYMEFPGRIL